MKLQRRRAGSGALAALARWRWSSLPYLQPDLVVTLANQLWNCF